MNRTVIINVALLTLLTACGSHTEQPVLQRAKSANASVGSPEVTGSASPMPSPTPPEYATLSMADLTGALLSIQDLPAGYSQDPPSKPGPDKTFCDYKPPFTQKVKVGRDFTKGGGLSTQVLSINLRQYKDSEQARTAFDALVKTLGKCHGETYQGRKMTYALMSAPKVGDDAVGIRITSDGTTILQNFAVVGPTLVSTGAGGLMDVNADQVAGLLTDQVNAYRDAASH